MSSLVIDHERDMKARPFAIGDTAMLKSGGCAMTVAALEPQPDLLTLHPVCIWHGADGRVQSRPFHPLTLTPLRLDRTDEPPAQMEKLYGWRPWPPGQA